MLLHTPTVELGQPAHRFILRNVNGQMLTRDDVKGENGLGVMFICNHCPYVKGIVDRLTQDMAEVQKLGFGVVAINSNDADTYPEDSFDNMKLFAKNNRFTFPYLYDEEQRVAQEYGAICTPDFFIFDEGLRLHYRGRLDDAGKGVFVEGKHTKELLNAAKELSEEGRLSVGQYPSMGCSIKWK